MDFHTTILASLWLEEPIKNKVCGMDIFTGGKCFEEVLFFEMGREDLILGLRGVHTSFHVMAQRNASYKNDNTNTDVLISSCSNETHVSLFLFVSERGPITCG